MGKTKSDLYKWLKDMFGASSKKKKDKKVARGEVTKKVKSRTKLLNDLADL